MDWRRMQWLTPLDVAAQMRLQLRRARAVVGLTNGCFDVLTAGHAGFLMTAAKQCQVLYVLLNSDASVHALKGDGRPIVPERERAFLLCSLRAVHRVVLFDGTDCAREIRALAPDVYIKSSEYRGAAQDPAEKAALEQCAARVIWVDRDPEYSTTALIGRSTSAALTRSMED